MAKQVYIIVFDDDKNKFDPLCPDINCDRIYCNNWRQVRSALRTNYYKNENIFKIYRIKWMLPNKGVWIKSLSKFIMKCTPK